MTRETKCIFFWPFPLPVGLIGSHKRTHVHPNSGDCAPAISPLHFRDDDWQCILWAHKDQGQNRDKQGQSNDRQGQTRDRLEPSFVFDCPCIASVLPLVPVVYLMSLFCPSYYCLSVPVSFLYYLTFVFTDPAVDQKGSPYCCGLITGISSHSSKLTNICFF